MKSNGLKFEEETVATPAEITFCNNKICCERCVLLCVLKSGFKINY